MTEKSSILIVDDRPENLIALKKTLEDVEIEILTATSGNEALKILLHHEFALILLDVMMPDMDGYELAELIRGQKETKKIPLIFLTAMDSTEKLIFKGYQAGAVDYLFKPVDDNILKNKINVFVELDQQKKELQQKNKDLEKAKTEANSANQAKSVFLSNMSHEIRTPMNAILGYAQILMRDKRLKEDQKKAVTTISKSGNNLLELINDVLDISKIEAGRMELNTIDFDLLDLIEGVKGMFQLICKNKKLFFKFEGIDNPIHVHGDEGKIRQILVNLIGNAVKFTDTGGVYFKLDQSENHQYQFTVKDTGKGIPPEAQDSIFMAFNQDAEGHKKGGTGLGLAISKKQTELMEGNLTVQSERGAGATFFLTLSLPPAKEEIKTRSNRDMEVVRLKEGQKVKALVADDIEENRSVLSKFLVEVGMEVIQVENGKEAVESFRKNRPDIVYMDVRMPVMDGVEAIRQLRKEFPENELKIVVVSASVLKHEREQYEKLGCSEILQKPFRMEKIYSSAQNLLGIEYEYEQKEIDQENIPVAIEIDYSNVCFPQDIITKLDEAVQVCNITEMDKLLNDLEPKNNDERNVIKDFFDYKSNYNTEGLSKILDELKSNAKS
jgi:signal transduction histidine kinase